MNAQTTQAKRELKYKSRPTALVRLQQSAKVRKDYVAQIPRWRRPGVGYLMTFPLVGLGCLVVYLEYLWLTHFYFSGIPIIVASMFVALIWGLGPAIFSVLLGSLALGLVFITFYNVPNAVLQDRLLSLIPFVIAGFIVAIITGQREAARIRALVAEQEANEHAGELERANQELEEANLLKDRFLSMASHELKTPITTISGLAQVALHSLHKNPANPIDASTVEKTMMKIDEQALRLNALVNDLLDLNNIRSGHIPLQIGDCDLTAICREVGASQSQLSGRQIEMQMSDSPLIVKADRDRMEQVISNLVSNALKYSPDDTPVQLATGTAAHGVCIAVRDRGQGIVPEQLPHIFETFYRTPGARTSNTRGWGLGLAICKDIVERHGGTIRCESQPGRGSTFYVELPMR